MGDDGPRRKNARRKSAQEDKADAIPDELLGLVFLRLTSPLDLIRATFTCRHWHHVFAEEGFRVLCALHGASSSKVTGRYLIDRRLRSWRLPGRHPIFVPSSSSSWIGVTARNLALDFLPRTEYGKLSWELANVRGGLLLRPDFNNAEDGWSWAKFSCLIVCDPLAHRYMTIPPSGWFHGSHFFAVALLHAEDAGVCISLSNFRVMCAIYQNGIAKSYAFSSAPSGHWTSSGTSARCNRVLCGNDYWTAVGPINFIGSNMRFALWSVRNYVLALDKESGELSSYAPPVMVVPGGRGRVVLEYVLELPWPPTFRASLS